MPAIRLMYVLDIQKVIEKYKFIFKNGKKNFYKKTSNFYRFRTTDR